jgi:hypothetical protein
MDITRTKFKVETGLMLAFLLFLNTRCTNTCELTVIQGLSYRITLWGYFNEQMKGNPDYFFVYLEDFDSNPIIDPSSKCDSIFSISMKIINNEPRLSISEPFILHLVNQCTYKYEPRSESSIANVSVINKKISEIELYNSNKKIYSKRY